MENNEILKSIQENGYCITPKFNTEEVSIIKSELMEIYDTMPDYSSLYSKSKLDENSYTYGKHLRFGSLNEIPKFKSVFLSKNLSSVTKGYLGNNCHEAMQIFSTHEYMVMEEGKEKPRNSFWHFDPYYALKYFIYLTDTTIENGCLRVIPNSLENTKKLRNKIPFNEICDGGYIVEHLINKCEEPINLEAKSGDLVVFDTDLFHVGSNLQKKGAERMVIIVHNRPR